MTNKKAAVFIAFGLLFIGIGISECDWKSLISGLLLMAVVSVDAIGG